MATNNEWCAEPQWAAATEYRVEFSLSCGWVIVNPQGVESMLGHARRADADREAAALNAQPKGTVMATNETPATGQGHTPEPWGIDITGTKRYVAGLTRVPELHWNGRNHMLGSLFSDVDSARAVACVNACAGMADPATTIRELREALRVAVAENEAWKAGHLWRSVVNGETVTALDNEGLHALNASDQNDQIRRVRGEVKDG